MKRFYSIALALFSTFWIFIIFSDYMQKHPLYSHAINNFKYIGLLLFYIIFVAGTAFLTHNRKRFLPKENKYLNWLSLAGVIVVIMLTSLFAYMGQINKLNIELNNVKIISNIGVGNVLFFLKGFFLVLLSTFFVVFTARLLGNFISTLLGINVNKNAEGIIDTGIGIMLITTIIFFIGIFSLINPYVIFPVFFIIIALNWKKAIELLKSLIRPFKIPENLNWMGAIGIASIIIICAINFNQILRPIPTGFDALTTYVNLPRLLSDHGSLVTGYQPHNWSLFMSLGFVLFNMTEVTLTLSMVGGLLSLAAMYYLGRHWLKIDINYLWLGLAAFYLTPTIVHQSSKELKVDLGLLFIQLIIIVLFIIWYYREVKDEHPEEKVPDNLLIQNNNATNYSFGFLSKLHHLKIFEKIRSSNTKFLIILGMLTGYSLGIKLTSLFVLLAVVASIWTIKKDWIGYFSIFFFSIFAVLLAKVDNIGGLRVYHLSATTVQWASFALGLLLLCLTFIKDSNLFLMKFKSSLLYVVISVFCFLPWVGKNFAETKSTDVSILLNGKHIGPPVSVDMLDRNWKKIKGKKIEK